MRRGTACGAAHSEGAQPARVHRVPDRSRRLRRRPVLTVHRRKWGISKLDALRDLFNGHAWLPPGIEPSR
jgi:hypothetical protein